MAEKCPQCGAELPRTIRGAHCLHCLLQLGLTQEDEVGWVEQAAALLPTPSELALGGWPGPLIDRFRLLKQVGAGAFGVVFLAEQHEPVHRRVALKVIKSGLASTSVISRFETERQVLAVMDHPNIAKVLDGGTTPAGQPYLVMEFVDGIPITQYCEHFELSVRERLRLFIQVCEAVQHAHQKGIIHCDIKPSNILVTKLDDKAVAKVIDFGIAKATLGQKLTEDTRNTVIRQFAGTPAYMSPEQAGMGGLDVDARSDIYSLGMLLYELLTAQTAFDAAELQHGSIDEVCRIIREKEPQRPSTKLTSLSGDRLSAIAASRGTDSARLIGLLRGDLDWIVIKALEKDRNRRYETANGFGMDIERHLNLEPVIARPPSRLYRLRRQVQRNKLAFAAGGIVFVTLILAVAATSWQAVLARQAERGQMRVAQLLKEMLTGVRPSVARGRDTTVLREILDKTSARLEELKELPEVEAELRATIGTVYLALGDYDQAERMCRRAVALRERFKSKPLTFAAALNDLGNVLYRQGKLTEAEATQRKALAIRKRRLAGDDPEVATSLSNLANVLWAQGRLAEAERLHREALAIRRHRLGNLHEDTVASLDNLGGVMSAQEEFAEAETIQREAVALNIKLLGKVHPDVALSMNNLADTLHAEGKLNEAEAMDVEVLALRKKLFGEEHPDVAFSLHNLASVLLSEGKLSEAEGTNRLALAMRRKLLGNRHIDVAGSLNNLAAVLIQEQKLTEAERCQREAIDIQKEALGPAHQDIAGSLENLGVVQHLQGKPAEAEAFFGDAIAMFRKVMGNQSLDAARCQNGLATALRTQSKLIEAEAASRESLAIRTKLLGKQHADVANSLGSVAAVLFEQGKPTEAEKLQREELALWRKLTLGAPSKPVFSQGLADCLARLIRTVLAQEQFTSAEPLARECSALTQKQSSDDWSAFHARSLLGGSLAGQRKFSEAEPLLLSGYEGMRTRIEKIPPEEEPRLKEALERVVRFYEASGNSEKTAAWRQLLSPP